MNDRIQAWLKEKETLDNDPEAIDSVYVNEQRDILISVAEDIFKEMLNGQ